ncbi:hypothetical protein ACFL96_00500 [Thermoproteota archaeon]
MIINYKIVSGIASQRVVFKQGPEELGYKVPFQVTTQRKYHTYEELVVAIERANTGEMTESEQMVLFGNLQHFVDKKHDAGACVPLTFSMLYGNGNYEADFLSKEDFDTVLELAEAYSRRNTVKRDNSECLGNLPRKALKKLGHTSKWRVLSSPEDSEGILDAIDKYRETSCPGIPQKYFIDLNYNYRFDLAIKEGLVLPGHVIGVMQEGEEYRIYDSMKSYKSTICVGKETAKKEIAERVNALLEGFKKDGDKLIPGISKMMSWDGVTVDISWYPPFKPRKERTERWALKRLDALKKTPKYTFPFHNPYCGKYRGSLPWYVMVDIPLFLINLPKEMIGAIIDPVDLNSTRPVFH